MYVICYVCDGVTNRFGPVPAMLLERALAVLGVKPGQYHIEFVPG